MDTKKPTVAAQVTPTQDQDSTAESPPAPAATHTVISRDQLGHGFERVTVEKEAAFVQRADLPPQPESTFTISETGWPGSKSQLKRLTAQGTAICPGCGQLNDHDMYKCVQKQITAALACCHNPVAPVSTDLTSATAPDEQGPQGGKKGELTITVWKDGAYLCQEEMDDYYCRNDLDWLCSIPLISAYSAAPDWTQMSVSELAAGNASLKAYSDELEYMRILAADPHSIHSVKDKLGPLSLWSESGIKARDDAMRIEGMEIAAQLVENFAYYPSGVIRAEIERMKG